MKIQHAIALAVVVGLGLGVIATRGLAAQAKRTFYAVIEVDETTIGVETLIQRKDLPFCHIETVGPPAR